MAEFVIDDAFDLRGQLCGQEVADRFSQTADDTVFLAGDDLAALLCGGKYQFSDLVLP